VTSFPVGGPGFLGQVGASGNDRIMMARPLFAAGDTGYFLFVAAVTLAAVQLDIVSLLERGFHKPGDVKNRLEYCVGQLALSIIRL